MKKIGAHSRFKIFCQLIRRDLVLFRRDYFQKAIDFTILLMTNALVFGYLMPLTGRVPEGYGPFIIVGAIASFGLFDSVGRTGVLIADITGHKAISYTLTLPIPSWMVFSYFAVSWSIISCIISLSLLVVAKLFFFDLFPLSHISIWRFFVMFIVSNFFLGFFALWLTSFLRGPDRMEMVWNRIIVPLFMFGGYFYTWKVLFAVSPVLGYINLLNPLLYILEGMRNAILSRTEYLGVGISASAVLGFTFLIAWDAVRRFKKRLNSL